MDISLSCIYKIIKVVSSLSQESPIKKASKKASGNELNAAMHDLDG